jgi:hypothetical protein
MSYDPVSELEPRVIEALQAMQDPQAPQVLIQQLVEERLDESLVRECIWRLIESRTIDFTKDWKLKLASQVAVA